MEPDRSRFTVGVFIVLVSLSAAYATRDNFSGRSAASPAARLHADLNAAFVSGLKARTGRDVKVGQARSRSGKPVHITADGLDVPALALSSGPGTPHDRETSAGAGPREFLAGDFEAGSRPSPYTSTIVFLVRKGNPKGVKDWDDLARTDIKVVAPDPKRTEAGRWNYLAAWGYALKRSGGDEQAARKFVRGVFADAETVNHEGRKPGPSAFVFRNTDGDVLPVWENEAHLLVRNNGADLFEIVTPSASIAAEPAISVVDASGEGSGARGAGASYLAYLHTPQAQHIAARHYYRPRDPQVAAGYENRFPPIAMFTVDEISGGWRQTEKKHFSRGGVVDQVIGEAPLSAAVNRPVASASKGARDGQNDRDEG